MMTSSSRKIIKSTNAPQGSVIEPYIPPVEVMLKIAKPRRSDSMPQADAEGMEDLEFLSQTEIPQEERELDEREQLLADARAEAETLLADAREQAAKIQEDAREAGYEAGYASGYEDGRQKVEAAFQEELEARLLAFEGDIKAALHAVETAKEQCLRNYMEDLKDCAIAIGEKVIQISLRSSGEVIKQMIISATEKLKKTAWVKIYIDKYDYDMMMEADADILSELSHLSDNIKFIVMDKEESGNCIIEMPEEIVDVSVNTQMENIKDILENVRV